MHDHDLQNFEKEKAGLIHELQAEIQHHPQDELLPALLHALLRTDNPSQLNGLLSRMVIDQLEFILPIGEKILAFERRFRDQ